MIYEFLMGTPKALLAISDLPDHFTPRRKKEPSGILNPLGVNMEVGVDFLIGLSN